MERCRKNSPVETLAREREQKERRSAKNRRGRRSFPLGARDTSSLFSDTGSRPLPSMLNAKATDSSLPASRRSSSCRWLDTGLLFGESVNYKILCRIGARYFLAKALDEKGSRTFPRQQVRHSPETFGRSPLPSATGERAHVFSSETQGVPWATDRRAPPPRGCPVHCQVGIGDPAQSGGAGHLPSGFFSATLWCVGRNVCRVGNNGGNEKKV